MPSEREIATKFIAKIENVMEFRKLSRKILISEDDWIKIKKEMLKNAK